MEKRRLLAAAGAVAFMAATAHAGIRSGAGVLLVPESTNDHVMAFDPFDGSLVNMNFIVSGGELNTPINAIQVGGEIWVSDQLSDGVFRYSLGGAFLGQFNLDPLDNVRGIEWANGNLFVSNSGTGGGAPGDGIVVFDSSGNQINHFATDDDPFDVLAVSGVGGADLLVNDISGTPDEINKYAFDGTFGGQFAAGGDISFPEQMTQRANGNILLANFSSNVIQEFDTAGGLLNTWNTGETGLRGVHELGNGNIMFTTGSGVFTFDPSSGAVDQVVSGVSARFIEFAPIPAPGAIALLGLAGFVAKRRRRH